MKSTETGVQYRDETATNHKPRERRKEKAKNKKRKRKSNDSPRPLNTEPRKPSAIDRLLAQAQISVEKVNSK